MNISELHQLFLNSSGVSTDTRTLQKHNLFFALSGSNFNGNKFAQQALEKGATKAIIDDADYLSENTFLVKDCLQSLQDLANYHRNHLKTPIIAITGSNGKTTTKELINEVLQQKYQVVSTKGNLNNHIGVPLTLLSMNKNTEIGIVEMGANHQGEIKELCHVAQPNYGYITNFGKAHLEGFGGPDGVIKGKSELYDYLKSQNETLFINAEDHIQIEKSSNYHKTISFGNAPSVNYLIRHTPNQHLAGITYKSHKIDSQLTGNYNSANMAAATGIGLYFNVGIELIKNAIENYKPSNNRSQLIELKGNTIILDAYNANPTSMALAIENLSSLSTNKKVAILGDMFEVGPTSEQEHQNIIDLLENTDVELGLVCGQNFHKTKTNKVISFSHFDQLKSFLSEKKIENSTILIKGSRGMQLERVLEVWK